MNLSFYVAISHLPLGNGVAIEFIGPITVAAATTRTRRNAVALTCAVAGVALLSGTEIDHDAVGLGFILLAAALWAGYIVVGARVARQSRGTAGLALGLAVGLAVTAPWGLPGFERVVGHPAVLLGALGVGVMSSAIPYGIDQVVLRRIPLGRFALLQALLPVVATVMGVVVLGQGLSTTAAVGIVAVVAGVATRDRS